MVEIKDACLTKQEIEVGRTQETPHFPPNMKEKQIISQYSLTKQQLLDARESSDFVEGDDWSRGTGKGPASAITWSPSGLQKLLKSKNVDVILTDNVIRTSAEKTKEVTSLGEQVHEHLKASPSATETCPAVVRQKYPSKNVVRCEIRGESCLVYVKDSHFLRVGSIITAKRRGERYYSSFKVDGMGRIHA